jgi:hypothetical protein
MSETTRQPHARLPRRHRALPASDLPHPPDLALTRAENGAEMPPSPSDPVVAAAEAGGRQAPMPAVWPARAARIGIFAGLDAEGRALVETESGADPQVAIVAAPCPDGAIEAARGRRVVLLFEEGDPDRPLIVGWVAEALSADPAERRYVRADARVLVLEGREEVELRCGEASIRLTRDGRVVVRGKAILSDAQGMHRIRGAAVRIN